MIRKDRLTLIGYLHLLTVIMVSPALGVISGVIFEKYYVMNMICCYGYLFLFVSISIICMHVETNMPSWRQRATQD